jgi:hypothetical protein
VVEESIVLDLDVAADSYAEVDIHILPNDAVPPNRDILADLSVVPDPRAGSYLRQWRDLSRWMDHHRASGQRAAWGR